MGRLVPIPPMGWQARELCDRCLDTGTIGFLWWKKTCPKCKGNPRSLLPPRPNWPMPAGVKPPRKQENTVQPIGFNKPPEGNNGNTLIGYSAGAAIGSDAIAIGYRSETRIPRPETPEFLPPPRRQPEVEIEEPTKPAELGGRKLQLPT